MLQSETHSQFGSGNVAFGGAKKENMALWQISFQPFKGSRSFLLVFTLVQNQSENSQTRLNVSLERRVGATLSKGTHCPWATTPEWSYQLNHSRLGDLDPLALLPWASVSPKSKTEVLGPLVSNNPFESKIIISQREPERKEGK